MVDCVKPQVPAPSAGALQAGVSLEQASEIPKRRAGEGCAGGFRAPRLDFALETTEPRERIDTLLKITERYRVVLQT